MLYPKLTPAMQRALHRLFTNPVFQLLTRELPLHEFVIRHGFSFGNLLTDLMHRGQVDELAKHSAVLPRHGSRWELTQLGQSQATQAGEWLRRELIRMGFNPLTFFHLLVASSHVRAEQTAALVALAMGFSPDAKIFKQNPWRSERSWGVFDYFVNAQLDPQRYEQLRTMLRVDPLHVAPLGGESLIGIASRGCYPYLQELRRKWSFCNALSVAHGEVIWMDRFIREGMSVQRFMELDRSTDPCDRLQNGSIVQYTRVNPITHQVSRWYSHVRIVCPWAPQFSRGWEPINREMRSPRQMLQEATMLATSP